MTAPRRAVVVIPAYEPAPLLVGLVRDLSADGRTIVVVDDGSSAQCAATFASLAACANVVVLAHAVNLGKGQALKTAFNYVLLHTPADAVGVVTADADGQHLAADVRRVAERLERASGALVLGSRRFEGCVPLRSRIGNVITRAVFRFLIGRSLVDTQTGLRGIPQQFLGELTQLEAGRYEFELEMLVRAAERGMAIEEIPIQTVYGSFARSHFNPLRDSLRIYFVFLRFTGLSIVTAGIDYTVFTAAYLAGRNILAAFVAARLVAGAFNFTANRTLVFRSRGGVPAEAGKYALLVAALMMVSYGLVSAMVRVLGVNVLVAKVVAEGGLFITSFALQNLVVFGDRQARPAAPGLRT
jgi:glycosyltransferase involved in cell wall biosynthesis